MVSRMSAISAWKALNARNTITVVVCAISCACEPQRSYDGGAARPTKEQLIVDLPFRDSEVTIPVFAIYRQPDGLDTGRARDVDVAIAIYSNGQIVYSNKPIEGGPPYGVTNVGEENVAHFVATLDKQGAFSNPVFRASHFGPDSVVTTIACRVDDRGFAMRSWHEYIEADSRLVATDRGAEPLRERSRAIVLGTAKPEYQEFRRMWELVRSAATDLLTQREPGTSRFQFKLVRRSLDKK
ncbi:hypothetical protein RAS1_16890 [Phycisphaerae bacterium RAS1]|nr:hypothetical protein RAS1_16890 [Phycisphaerae bacterium RAS1]